MFGERFAKRSGESSSSTSFQGSSIPRWLHQIASNAGIKGPIEKESQITVGNGEYHSLCQLEIVGGILEVGARWNLVLESVP